MLSDKTWLKARAGDTFILPLDYEKPERCIILEVALQHDVTTGKGSIYGNISKVIHVGPKRLPTDHIYHVGQGIAVNQLILHDFSEFTEIMKPIWAKTFRKGFEFVYATNVDNPQIFVARMVLLQDVKPSQRHVPAKLINIMRGNPQFYEVGITLQVDLKNCYSIGFSPINAVHNVQLRHVSYKDLSQQRISLTAMVNRTGDMVITHHTGPFPENLDDEYIFSSGTLFTPWGHRVLIEAKVKLGDRISLLSYRIYHLWPSHDEPFITKR